MAVTVVASTLMLLLSKSGDDFQSLWQQGSAVNDPSNNKHSMEISDVISGGNFRSSKIENWTAEEFDLITLTGLNTYGDVLWETEFNASGTTFDLDSWLISNKFVGSSSTLFEPQSVLYSTDSYRIQVDPTTIIGRSWFGITVHDLTYQPLPLFFAARSPIQPFVLPAFVEGRLGCWKSTTLTNWTYAFTDAANNSPDVCVLYCTSGFNTAVLVFSSSCYCANHDPTNLPADESSYCFRPCPGDGAVTCGGFTTTEGDAYYISSGGTPGKVKSEMIYQKTFAFKTSIEINITDVYNTTDDIAHITSINTSTIITSSQSFSIEYSNEPCTATAYFKHYGNPPHVFPVTELTITVDDILPVRCMRFTFTGFIVDITIQLFGVPDTSDHIEVSVVAVIGKKIIPVTTTSTTVAATTTTAAPTTTTAAPTTTTAAPTTTTAAQTTTTTAPTTTSTAAPTTTTNATTTTVAPTTSTVTSLSTTSSTSTTTVTTTSTTVVTPSPTTSTTQTSVTTLSSTSAATTTSGTAPTSTTTGTSGQNTTQTSAVVSPTTTTAATCFCPCGTVHTKTNYTSEELAVKIQSIQKKLAVNISELSSTIRKLTSAEDSRPSAVGIGVLGISFLVAMFSAIVIIDSSMIVRDLKQLFENIRFGFKGSS